MYVQMFSFHAKLLKAIAHPKRLEIIHLLRDQPLCVSDIEHMLGLPQANLSQHLQVLRAAGVVKTKKDGKQIFYGIAHRNFVIASDAVREILIERHQHDGLATELTKSMKDLIPIVQDPVCGMRVSPKTAGVAHEYNGRTYYFCASGCLDQFKANPLPFINTKE